MPVDERQIVTLPLVARSSGVLRRCDSSKDGSGAADSLHRTITVDHLRLVQPTKVDAAVSLAADLEFDVQSKVTERLFGAEVSEVTVRAEILFRRFVDHHSPFHAPAVAGIGGLQFPSAQVRSVEQFDRWTELDRLQIGLRRHRWTAATDAHIRDSRHVLQLCDGDLLIFDCCREAGRAVTLPLAKCQLPVIEFDVPRATSAAECATASALRVPLRRV